MNCGCERLTRTLKRKCTGKSIWIWPKGTPFRRSSWLFYGIVCGIVKNVKFRNSESVSVAVAALSAKAYHLAQRWRQLVNNSSSKFQHKRTILLTAHCGSWRKQITYRYVQRSRKAALQCVAAEVSTAFNTCTCRQHSTGGYWINQPQRAACCWKVPVSCNVLSASTREIERLERLYVRVMNTSKKAGYFVNLTQKFYPPALK